MRTVRSTESIVHKQITQLGKSLGKFWIISLFTRVKPDVLQ